MRSGRASLPPDPWPWVPPRVDARGNGSAGRTDCRVQVPASGAHLGTINVHDARQEERGWAYNPAVRIPPAACILFTAWGLATLAAGADEAHPTPRFTQADRRAKLASA